jgi:hypothetical protein
MNQITEVTRRNIFDAISMEKICWAGRLNEVNFLARIFNLKALPSTDRRFADASQDIWQHRVNNDDWKSDWVFFDPRLNLMYCEDEVFLRFLCETIHPVTRSDADEVQKLLSLYNNLLKFDGFELIEYTRISEKPLFKGNPLSRAQSLLFKIKSLDSGRVDMNAVYPPRREPQKAKLKVFICHASEDKPKARELYYRLVEDGYDAWFDEEKLLPGQDWQMEIKKTVQDSGVFIVLLSHKAVSKTGYVQKEIIQALDYAQEQPEGTIIIVPVKLEECPMPQRLNHLHWVNFVKEDAYEKLLGALMKREEDLAI